MQQGSAQQHDRPTRRPGDTIPKLWQFAVVLVAACVGTAVFPGVPIAIAAAASFTPIRRNRTMLVVLWITVGLLTAVQVIPFVQPTGSGRVGA